MNMRYRTIRLQTSNEMEGKTMKRVILFTVLILVHLTIIASAEAIVEAAKNGDLQTVKKIAVLHNHTKNLATPRN
jgi:hypothetical protein